MERIIFDFKELRKEDSEIVGKKCANLGELMSAGFRVPPGFAVSLSAYKRFMTETGLVNKIESFLSPLRLDPNDPAHMPRFEEVSVAIRQMVEATDLPLDIESAIRERYQMLCEATGVNDLPVATRSAGPVSHPGQYETYLHIRGASDVVRHVRKVWASTFNTRSLIARSRQGLPLSFDPIGVAVLQMVDAKAAGVMFTVNPTDGDHSKIYIESNWGLGESVVAGEVTPDSFVVSKATSEILSRNIPVKRIWYTLDNTTARVSQQPIPE